MVRTRLRTAVERNHSNVVNHLDIDRDVTRRLHDPVIVVIEARHHGAGLPLLHDCAKLVHGLPVERVEVLPARHERGGGRAVAPTLIPVTAAAPLVVELSAVGLRGGGDSAE